MRLLLQAGHALRPVRSEEDWRHLHAIRRDVLFSAGRHAVAYDENHPDDRRSGHEPFLLTLDDRPIGTVRLDVRGPVGIVRLVAITGSEQRHGHGRALANLIEEEARRRGVETLHVNAASDAVGYYEKMGWRRDNWDGSELAGLAAKAVQMTKRISPRRAGKAMRLTERHVAALAREIADPGPRLLPGFRPAEDPDYHHVVSAILDSAPSDGLWVFAYGSLIWNPAFDFTRKQVALAKGWRRSFCLGWDYRFRGNSDQPGLMLALDRGGQCTGVAFRLPEDRLRSTLDGLIRREMSMVPSAFPWRWIKVATAEGPIRALTFAMNRNSGRYICGLGDEELADVLAAACGFRGSMAEYLFSTVQHLETLGIHDRYLWRMQELVAERIERTHGI